MVGGNALFEHLPGLAAPQVQLREEGRRRPGEGACAGFGIFPDALAVYRTQHFAELARQVKVELAQVEPASIGVVVAQQKAPLREQVSQLGVLQLADQFVNIVCDQVALVNGSPDREKFEFLPLGPGPDWTTAENSILVL